MHHKHYRTEAERLASEKKEAEAFKRNDFVNFEKMNQTAATALKFDVSKCLSTERTYPACVSSVKAPVELESHL